MCPPEDKELPLLFFFNVRDVVGCVGVCDGGGQMSTQTPLINPDQTSGMLPQCCHSVKEGQE